MIPLTRSRLNCYNSGVIDLSNSYQNNGNSSSSSSSGSHIHNYNGSSNRSVRPLAWNASSSGNVVQSHQLQYPKITSSSSSSSLDKPTQKQAQNYRNHDLHTTSNREASRKRKISDEEMEDVKEKQQYQSKKRDSHAGTGSGHMRKSIDSHMDDANINQPPTQSTFTPKPAPNSKPTRQPDPASRSQSTSTPSGPPALLSIEVSSRVSSTRPSSPSTSPPSSSSSQDDAAQDESGDQKSENTSSDEDGEQDEDKESDEDGELDKDGESNEDQVQSEPLQAQNGRCENGRFSNATLIEYRKYQAHFKVRPFLILITYIFF